LLVLIFGANAHAADVLRIRIYHTNDIHGWIMERPDKARPGKMIGGAAPLGAVLAAEKGPKLLLDAGDWWQGTPEGSLSRGTAVAEMFNALGYDGVVVGNHEFDGGEPMLKELVAKIHAPVLSANSYRQSDGRRSDWAGTSIVKEVAGVKFGIFGLTTSKMSHLAFPINIAGLRFRREIDEAREQVTDLRRRGATVVIAVTHIGLEAEASPEFEGDRALAREVEGIDVIVGGHTHTTLAKPLRDAKHGTLIVQTGSYLTKVGRVTLDIDPSTKRVLKSDDELIALRPDEVGEDPAMKALVAKYQEQVGRAFDVVLATAAADLTRGGPHESSLGSWMTDCYRRRTGADVGLQNGGGIRADIAAGPVTLRSVYGVMPFENYIVKLTLDGAALRAALSHGFGMGEIAQVSGVAAEIRRGRGGADPLAAATVGGAPIDDARRYTVATLDFLVSGDGYASLAKAASREDTGILARDMLKACAVEQMTVVPPALGRLKIQED
jgi:2',3'-cyclic-nucleotide 2'-phosphodiesterase (5'-nucleotidase family)